MPVSFQRQDALGDWNDLPSSTVLTNQDGQAVYNYIVDNPNIPESLKEPQNRLPITIPLIVLSESLAQAPAM